MLRAPDELEPDWNEALERVVVAEDQPRLVFQPIVELQEGKVVGYEALSRFDGPPDATPDRWFDAAGRLGHGARLELRVVRRALQARADLPPNTFLSLNVSPATLLTAEARTVLDEADLRRVVFELTEQERVADYPSLKTAVARVRAAGGLVAVDDAGAGYSNLQHVLELRPEFVKLDRQLITNLDSDPAKRAVVRMLGDFASRIDSWIIAEGIERAEELDALTDLHVPLGQGWFLGRPAAPWSQPLDTARERLGERTTLDAANAIVTLVERRPTLPHDATPEQIAAAFAPIDAPPAAVLVTPDRRPVGIVRRGFAGPPARPTIISARTEIPEAAQRAVLRDVQCRLDPLVCCDAEGTYLGVVSIHRLLEWVVG